MSKVNLIKKLSGLMLLFLMATSCQNEQQNNQAARQDDDPKTQKIVLPEGFAIEHIYSPSDNEKGSWVAMTFDDKGRMITSDQYGGLFRLQLPEIGADSTEQIQIEALKFPKEDPADTSSNQVGMGFAQGLLYANNSLYVMVNNFPNDEFDKGSGLYRLQDTNGDDEFDKITKLLSLNGNGEHGPHSIVLGPDSSIYIVAGNHTDLPEMNSYEVPTNWQRDNLFPHILDPQGHATDRKEPGGWIAKTNADGSTWELISSGYRNPFDIAFNAEGELFTYDSDMEWDFGMPWYRPTRIVHVTGGSEYGWRTGNAKWDPEYPDNLPAILNVGQGSPTNLIFGYQARFPEKYQESLLAFDWSFGIIYAVHLQQKGASYAATAEEFISGSPLPLTDGEIGPDGALYFLTGGRRLDSDLYRVYHKDYKNIKPGSKPQTLNEKITLRHELEKLHRPSPEGTAEKIWEHLGDDDRFIRYAARIAVEHQPVESWKNLALQETNVVRLTEGLLALARQGDSSLKTEIFQKLYSIPLDKLNNRMLLNVLRVYEVLIYRMGAPNEAIRQATNARLNTLYPHQNNIITRELGKILVALDDDQVLQKTVPLLYTAKDDESGGTNFMSSSNLILRNPEYGLDIANMLANIPPAQQIYLATMISPASKGWTEDLRDQYFKWFYDAFGYKGGNSYIGFIDRARKIALDKLPKEQFAHFNAISGDSLLNEAGNRLALNVEGPKGPGRKWEIDSALKYLDEVQKTPDFKRGSELFIALRYASCHTMKGEGGSVGPDLTQLGTRFSNRDMLEAIIEPSKVISDQYESKVFHMKDGTKQLGRLMGEDENNYIISQNPYAPQLTIELAKNDVQEIRVSEVSTMPPGTLNPLSPEELVDIMAYLNSGADPDAEVYQPKN